MLLPGAEIFTRNVISFIFTCKALSDGSQKTIAVRSRITADGEVYVYDYKVTGQPVPGMNQDTAMLFPDDTSINDDTEQTCYLADFESRAQ